MKKITTTCLLLLAALGSGAGYAASPAPAAPPAPTVTTTEVQNSLESIVASCEKKKLPAEQEIECIEQGYLRFMGEDVEAGS